MSFEESALVTKLQHLNSTQQSIQVTSQWMIFHRKHAKACVAIWAQELAKANPSKRLGFLYLASDVIQNSKKKGEDYANEFGEIIPAIFATTLCHLDPETKGKVKRVVDVWRERTVYTDEFLNLLLKNSNISNSKPPSNTPSGASSLHKQQATMPLELHGISSKLQQIKNGEALKIASITSMNGLKSSVFNPSENEISVKEIANAKKVVKVHLEMLTSEIDIRKQLIAELNALTNRQNSAIKELCHQQEMTFEKLGQLESHSAFLASATTGSNSTVGNLSVMPTPVDSPPSFDAPNAPTSGADDDTLNSLNIVRFSELSSLPPLVDSNAISLGSISFGGIHQATLDRISMNWPEDTTLGFDFS
ncbi:hypothetical protein BDV3_006625 [Batrachochytrium dendrobatidis]